MPVKDPAVSSIEPNLLIDEESPLDTVLQDVKSKRATRCLGCKVSHDDHHWGLPGPHCQGISEDNGPFPLLRHTPESAWCIPVVVVKPADIYLCSLRQSHGILSLLFITLA